LLGLAEKGLDFICIKLGVNLVVAYLPSIESATWDIGKLFAVASQFDDVFAGKSPLYQDSLT
jgi:hypothetical protein